MKFEELKLNKNMLKSLQDLGFQEPTEVQEKTIPTILAGHDVIAGSATGSGKTLAFGAGILHLTERKKGIQSLVLTPTRELAEQIVTSLKKFSKYEPYKITAVYGGVSINPQIDALRSSEIVVGTPGRILDHLERRTIDLSRVKLLVLDEADRMLDMGFYDDVNKIMSQCRKEKQTLLFSATVSNEIKQIAKKFMNNPEHIAVSNQVDPKKLKQVYYDVKNNLKFSLLVHLLKKEESGLVMVFCNSRRYTDMVAKNLNKNKIDAMAIHGGLTQQRRNSIITKFNSKNAFVLVCTDVAARGLDIPGVSHVYNYEMPNDSKQYVHRIGRTARAGKSGIVINLISERDHDAFSSILREYDINVAKAEKPHVERVEMQRESANSSRYKVQTNRRSPRERFQRRRR